MQAPPKASAAFALGGRAQDLTCYCPDPGFLMLAAARYRAAFQAAQPFSHVVIDGLFPDLVLDRIVEELPARQEPVWTVWGSGSRARDPHEAAKRGISDEPLVGPVTRNFLLQLNSATFLNFMKRVSGLDDAGLVGDPTFNGGGIHSTGKGGRLLVHTDLERHPLGFPFCQSVNMIVYLNRDWPEAYGGHLELWSRDGEQCVERVLPVFNRTVIFESGTDTYHGHPEPLTCPEDRARYSLATYYYRINRPVDAHYAGFQRRVGWIHDNGIHDHGIHDNAEADSPDRLSLD